MKERSFLSCGYAVIDVIEGEEYFGGSAAAFAVNGKRLGMETGLCALFGEDQKSKEYWDFLTTIGVDLAYSMRFPDIKLPANYICHHNRNKGWEDYNITQYFPQINFSDPSALKKYGVIHFASAHPIVIEKVIKEIFFNPYRRPIISFSPGPKSLLYPELYLKKDFIRASDIVFFNKEEWQNASNNLNVSSPEELIALGPRIVLITLGPEGYKITYQDGNKTVTEEKQVEPINGEPTGAGDAFALGVLIGLQNRLLPPQATEVGAALANLALKVNGGIIDPDKINHFKDIDKFRKLFQL
jgi:sugar/nucleoside kinase (ribokinase family)